MKNKKILFVITEYWYFLSHRKNLVDFLNSKGFEICVLTNLDINKKKFYVKNNINIINWKIKRSSKNPFIEIYSIYKLYYSIKIFKPDIIYSVGIKPILYSAFCSNFIKSSSYIYAFAGLGSLFINTNTKKIFFQKIYFLFMKIFLRKKNSLIIFQNKDDKHYFNQNIKKKILQKIIKGSGVNTNKYKLDNKNVNNSNNINITLPARFLYDKGVMDFVYIAEKIKEKYDKVNFFLVGREDFQNPSAIKINILKKYEDNNTILIREDVKEMLNIYSNSDIICFPSFREGLPKALLEASACKIPMVAYDVPGSREIVKNNETGFLVSFRDKESMIEKLILLIENKELRNKFGNQAREMVINNYSEDIIFKKILFEVNCLLGN